jgi:hypothetical protein
MCPRCGGPIPNSAMIGQYPGALSRTDGTTEVCSDCGYIEAGEAFIGRLAPQSTWHSERREVVHSLRAMADFIELSDVPVGQVVMRVDLLDDPHSLPSPHLHLRKVNPCPDGCFCERCVNPADPAWTDYPHHFQRHVTPSLGRWVWEKRQGWRAYFGNTVRAEWFVSEDDFMRSRSDSCTERKRSSTEQTESPQGVSSS